MTEAKDPQPANRPRWRRSRLWVVLGALAPTVLVIGLLEGTLRLGASIGHGGSKYYLFYGFHGLIGRVGISPWSVSDGSHYKFPPHYVLRGAAGQGAHDTATTNSLGFRGPDFPPSKPPGTFRIISLGGSSTFGFHDSDTGTYPYLLQQLFNGRPEAMRVEVINGGFPYYNTGSVRSLLEKELVNYEPDLITLYAAFNDTGWPFEVGRFARALGWLQQHSITHLLLKEHVITDKRVYKWRGALQRRLRTRPDPILIDSQATRIAARYRRNVEGIADFAQAHRMRLLVIRQPMTASHRDPTAFASYEAEYQAVRRKLAEGRYLSVREGLLLIHWRLIRELDAIARERGLPVVDNIAIVDQDRSRLTSWVHLTEEANLRLAEALKVAIEPLIPDR